MLRTTRCLQDLPELLTVNNTEPLTADDVLDRLADLINQKQQAEDGIEEAKTVLSLMRKNGLIGDELSHPALTLKWQSRSTWQYSSAVKDLQGLEKVDGTATKKTSEGWTACPNKPQL